MIKTRNQIICCCLAILSGLVHAGTSSATDPLKLLVNVNHLQSQDSNDPPPPPPPPPPKPIVGHSWEGLLQSDRSECLTGIQIGVDSQGQDYIEQDGLVALVIHRSVDPAGRLSLIGYDPLENVYISVSAIPFEWTRSGEATTMEGEYQTYRLDRRGRKQVFDQGVLGIIAILIGL